MKKIVTLSFLVILAVFIVYLYQRVSPFYAILKQNNISPIFLANAYFSRQYPLKNEQGRTNILLLGVPGKNHDGSDLTDTMIFTSIDFNKKDVLMFSLPRDIWVDSLKDKLNSAYHYGEAKKENGGVVLTKEVINEVTNLPIHYTALIDFAGFEKLIDTVGGLDINVENSFTDSKYPIPGKENDTCGGDKEYKCRYETISFEKGWLHMDGSMALKFVRSRYAVGAEGTDFARENRQQKIIKAFQEKLLKTIAFKQDKISEIINTLKETIRTDLTVKESIYLGKFIFENKYSTRNISLAAGREDIKGFLVNPPVEKYERWVLEPRTGNFKEIQDYIKCSLDNSDCSRLIPQ